MGVLRGVNLGGWLALERWITPSLFEGTDAPDERTFMRTQGARERIEAHRETYIVDDDFAWLRRAGITAVRIPVGYWIIDPDEPYVGGLHHLDRAFDLADRHGLAVLLDLHGAPESQNGRDHSGRSGRADWFRSAAARDRTLGILDRLHARYRDRASYWGLELLNEPRLGLLHLALRRFTRAAAARLGGDARIVFHDAFTPRLMSGALRGDGRAVMDVHLYHMTSLASHVTSAERFVRWSGPWYSRLLRAAGRAQPVVVGEWSGVLRGDRLARVPETRRAALTSRYLALQLAVYERHAAGWLYWTYKTESRDTWNFRALVEDGVLRVPREEAGG
ncbi:MAG: glycoside hydrolase family 5 protein [Pseudoclavibacter sp.]